MPTKFIPLPPFERLNELLEYNPETGVCRWRDNPEAYSRKSAYSQRMNLPDRIVGFKQIGVYLQVEIDGILYLLHRIIWKLQTGEDPPSHLEIDHVTKSDPPNLHYDNRWENLRLSTHQENAMNQDKSHNSTSHFRGVSWHKQRQKWRVYIQVNGKPKHLGFFKKEDYHLAVQCRLEAEKKYYGDFAFNE